MSDKIKLEKIDKIELEFNERIKALRAELSKPDEKILPDTLIEVSDREDGKYIKRFFKYFNELGNAVCYTGGNSNAENDDLIECAHYRRITN